MLNKTDVSSGELEKAPPSEQFPESEFSLNQFKKSPVKKKQNFICG